MSQPVARFEGEWLHLLVKGKPGAKRAGLAGVHAGALRVAVCEAAEAGQATEAILLVLADAFAVARRDVELLAGEFAPAKRVRIRAPTIMPPGLLDQPG